MKLTKVSLAALVALGAFSSVASATPLEEAIKNVDVSGYARYRYTNTQTKDSKDGKTTEAGTSANHAFKSLINFKAAFDDRFFGVLGLRYDSKDGSGHKAFVDTTDTEDTIRVSELYLGYKAGNTTLTAGRQKLGTFFSDDEVGTGLRVVNTDVEGLTLAAVAFDALEVSRFTDSKLVEDIAEYNKDQESYGYNKVGNLYGVAAIGSYNPVSFQLWYASLVDVADLFAVEVAGDVALSDDVSFNLKGQFVNSDIDKQFKDNTSDYNDGHFYAFEAGTSLFGLDFTAGYIGWKVKPFGSNTGSAKAPFSFEDQGSLIDVGENNYDYTSMIGEGKQLFATVAYKFDKFGVGFDYRRGITKLNPIQLDDEIVQFSKEKQQEYVLRASYAHSKKLKFSTFYSTTTIKNVDGEAGTKNTEDKFRFEAKYSF